jgi:hypothetical protein
MTVLRKKYEVDSHWYSEVQAPGSQALSSPPALGSLGLISITAYACHPLPLNHPLSPHQPSAQEREKVVSLFSLPVGTSGESLEARGGLYSLEFAQGSCHHYRETSGSCPLHLQCLLWPSFCLLRN